MKPIIHVPERHFFSKPPPRVCPCVKTIISKLTIEQKLRIQYSKSKPMPTVYAPGVEYMVEHTMFIITRNGLYYIDRTRHTKQTYLYEGLYFKVLEPSTVRELITADSDAAT